MFKQLFILLFNLICYPQKAWASLSEELEEDVSDNNEKFYKNYLYPIIGIIALLSFVSVFLKEFSLQVALKTVLKQLFIYFGGFYLASYLFALFVYSRFKEEPNKLLCEKYVGFSSALVYGIAMLLSVFPALFFLQLIVFYTIYMVWEGATNYLKIDEDEMVRFTVYSSIVILFSPVLIEVLIKFLLPGMK
jgi:hypothetical protein